MRKLPSAFEGLSKDLKDDVLQVQRSKMMQYYASDYAREFTRRNDGLQPPLAEVSSISKATVAAQAAYIADNPNPLGSKELMDVAAGSAAYHALHQRLHPTVRQFLKTFGLYDVFLVEPVRGSVVYSVFKEADFGTSLKDGPYRQTGLAASFRNATQLGAGSSAFADFQTYLPSYNDPASFLAAPVMDNGETIGVAIFQIPLARITEIMSSRNGLGETGDVVLVGSDGLLRSDSFLEPKKYNVTAVFRDSQHARIDDPAIARAFKGEQVSGTNEKNYLGRDVFQAVGPINVFDKHWAIMVNLDRVEGLAEVQAMVANGDEAMRMMFFGCTGGFIVLAMILTFVGRRSARVITKPIAQINEVVQRVAKGDLSEKPVLDDGGELGALSRALADTVSSLRTALEQEHVSWSALGEQRRENARLQGAIRDLVSDLSAASDKLSDASTMLMERSGQSAVAAEQTMQKAQAITHGTTSVAAATEELSAGTLELSRSTQTLAAGADKAVAAVTEGVSQVKLLRDAGRKIAQVTSGIADIADQTKLLALNAAIEASSAGDAGRGFTVVASEVKELAQQTVRATIAIKEEVESINERSERVAQVIESLSQVVSSVQNSANTLAAAIEEQSASSAEIASNIARAADSAGEASVQIEQVLQLAKTSSNAAQGVGSSAVELSRLASRLEDLTRHRANDNANAAA